MSTMYVCVCNQVDSVESIDRVMRDGYKNRTVGSTLMNAESSRSHSIFTVVIEMNEPRDGGDDHFTKGKLNLVDLAGSERPSKVGNWHLLVGKPTFTHIACVHRKVHTSLHSSHTYTQT